MQLIVKIIVKLTTENQIIRKLALELGQSFIDVVNKANFFVETTWFLLILIAAGSELMAEEAEVKIIRAGWMKKKGNKGNLWGDRYFVLRGPTLSYYLKQTDTVRTS